MPAPFARRRGLRFARDMRVAVPSEDVATFDRRSGAVFCWRMALGLLFAVGFVLLFRSTGGEVPTSVSVVMTVGLAVVVAMLGDRVVREAGDGEGLGLDGIGDLVTPHVRVGGLTVLALSVVVTLRSEGDHRWLMPVAYGGFLLLVEVLGDRYARLPLPASTAGTDWRPAWRASVLGETLAAGSLLALVGNFYLIDAQPPGAFVLYLGALGLVSAAQAPALRRRPLRARQRALAG